MQNKYIFHIISSLANGGAENVLARVVEEFKKKDLEQIVITLNGSTNDFHYKKVISFCEVVDFKTEPNRIDDLFQLHANATVLAWMYKAIYYSHIWKIKNSTSQTIIWNIRHSNFGPKQIYQKGMLTLFGLASLILKPMVIYCSYKSKEVHEKAFFSKKRSSVIVNRLAKVIVKTKKIKNKKHVPFLLFVGRFDPQKGPKHLRDIISKFFNQEDTIELWIAGNGWDINYFPEEIQSRVKLLGNIKDIYYLYINAKGLLFTSIFGEGYPNVLVEAASVGLPIVGFEAGDSRLILEDFRFGYPVNTHSEFLDKLNYILYNPITEEQKKEETLRQQKLLDFNITVQEYLYFLTKAS